MQCCDAQKNALRVGQRQIGDRRSGFVLLGEKWQKQASQEYIHNKILLDKQGLEHPLGTVLESMTTGHNSLQQKQRKIGDKFPAGFEARQGNQQPQLAADKMSALHIK